MLVQPGIIQTIKVEWKSSLMKSTDYNPITKELIVEFNNGKKYLYKNFGNEDYDNLSKAESQGKYFLSNIRPRYKDNEVDVIKIEEPTNEHS